MYISHGLFLNSFFVFGGGKMLSTSKTAFYEFIPIPIIADNVCPLAISVQGFFI
jgi:hypothetical protein